jgi:small subunit ribosomal protein S16
MLRIRLTRTGKKHQPTYRIVVAEHTAPIKGKFVEILGYYLPTQKPKVFEVKKERVEYWMKNGATPSDTVHNLLVDAKILTDKREIRYSRIKPVEEVKAEPKKEAEAVAEVTNEAAEAPVEEKAEPEVAEPVEETSETPAEPESKPENPAE